MAKLQARNAEAEFFSDIPFNYVGELQLIDDRKGFAQFDDDVSGFKIEFLGSKFKYDANGFTGGTVNTVIFTDFVGTEITRISNLNLAATKVDAAMFSEEGVAKLISRALAGDDDLIGSAIGDVLRGANGDDVIKGRGGNDTLSGDAGNDILTGDGGNDTFTFTKGDGRDVITDFEIGEDNDSILLVLPVDSHEFVRGKGGDAKLLFENGDSILFKGVDFSDADQIEVFLIG